MPQLLIVFIIYYLIKGNITGIEWNEKTKYLAACSSNSLIKVPIIPLTLVLICGLTTGRHNVDEKTTDKR